MTSRIKQQQLVEDMTERYARLGTYRAVAGELDNEVSCALIQKVVKHNTYSPTLAKMIGIEQVRTRKAFDCTIGLRDAINADMDLLEIPGNRMLELMWEAWEESKQ